MVLEPVTHFFNPSSLEFLDALDHLSGVIDVIYVDQLSPVWGIRGHALTHQILRRRKFQTKGL